MRRALALLVPALVLVPAAPAAAVWVPAERVAGPTRIVRIGDDGDGFAVWSQDGTGGTDVRAARLAGNTWSPIATPLDANLADAAADPRVVVRADGAGVAAWVERYADG